MGDIDTYRQIHNQFPNTSPVNQPLIFPAINLPQEANLNLGMVGSYTNG